MRLEPNTPLDLSPKSATHAMHHSGGQAQRVAETVTKVVAGFRSQCDAQGIEIDLDLSGCEATCDAQFVQRSTTELIQNAIESMPGGGELTVTLVETPFQWELEVADSGANPSTPGQRPSNRSTARQETNDVPHILTFPASESIRKVIGFAQSNNATVESWTCPLGGTAWVLVVPKVRSRTASGTRAA